MNRATGCAIVALIGGLGCSAAAQATDVAVCTDMGRFVIELADAQAPKHVANFLQYVDAGFYSGTVLHRAVPGFVVQGGGVDRNLRARPTLPPIENESGNGLSNVRGSVAAARTSDPDSATSQFYVNLVDNRALDGGAEPGYTVFGRVKEGLDVLDRISMLPTHAAGPFPGDVPDPLVAIRFAVRFDAAAYAELPEDGRAAAIKERALAALAAGEHAEALRWIDLYHADCGALDPELLLAEATAAAAADRRLRARYVMEEYFQVVDASHPTHSDAVAFYRELAPDGEQSAAVLSEQCEKPESPAVPDGATATFDEMFAAQQAVQEFVAGGEAYLECLAKIIDDQRQSATFRNAAIGEHNQTVAEMETLAQHFNEELREFKARE